MATRQQADRVRRTVAELQAVADRREHEFASHGIESIAAYRSMRASGEITGDRVATILLVVDGWLTIRQEYVAGVLRSPRWPRAASATAST